MKFSETIKNFKNRIKGLLTHELIRYAIIIHLFYFFLSIILCLVFFREQNDFLIFYKAGNLFRTDITGLYNPENYIILDQAWNFRYFPLSALLFVPFSLIDFNSAYIIFTLSNLMLNLLICILIYKIIALINEEKDDRKVIKYISIFLMSTLHIYNYILGQINLYITLLILISLFIFLKYNDIKWQLIGSVILGISILIKPITICIIPFLLVLQYNFKLKTFTFDLKKSSIRLIGALIPVSLNLIIFFRYPVLLNGFLEANFSGDTPIIPNFSFSISKLIRNFYNLINVPFEQVQVLVLIILTAIVGGLGLIIFIIGNFNNNRIIYGYLFGILIMLLVYFDSWNHHLLILTPILIMIMFELNKGIEPAKKYVRYNFLFLSFLDLPFMLLWYLMQDVFPFNFAFTISLILIFYAISKFSLKSKEER
ncbi:MAG: glycosyltransferase family 87 protein [Promethearchaeota archaeon]